MNQSQKVPKIVWQQYIPHTSVLAISTLWNSEIYS
jgi:hypothetical protein